MVDTHPPVVTALARAAADISTPRSLAQTLDAIADSARRTVPGFDHAGVSVRHKDGTIETLAATDQLVNDLDDVQYRLGQGPCVDAIEHGQLTLVEHLPTERRWPDYLPHALEHGLRAQLGIALTIDGESVGGLNLYSTATPEIHEEAVTIAQLFATHAALALGWAQHDEQLGEALRTRKTIGQAIGIVMERYQIDEDRAFHFLLRTSSTSNTKLRDVAQELVSQANDRTPSD
jgi:GAF domain-containing protein